MRPLIAVLLLASVPALAQSEFYNLDDDRPTLTEDAYTTEYRGLELQLGLSHLDVETDATTALFLAEAKYGLVYNLHVGVAGRAYVGSLGQTAVSGFSDTSLFALYNFNRESNLWPALALRVDVGFPTGRYSSSGVRALVKGILTRTFGHVRLHLNGAYGFGAGPRSADLWSELAARHWVSAAVDYPLNPNLVGILETYYLRQPDGEAEVNAMLGMRWQLFPRWVLDAGVGRSVLPTGSQLMLTVGLTASPGVPWLY